MEYVESQVAKRFGLSTLVVEKALLPRYVRKIYEGDYKTSEFKMVQQKKSRTTRPMIFETLAIYAANQGFYPGVIPLPKEPYLFKLSKLDAQRVATRQAAIALVASLEDDVMDEVVAPQLAEKGQVSENDLIELAIHNAGMMQYLTRPFHDELSGIDIDPIEALLAAGKLTKAYERDIMERSVEAYNIYKQGRYAMQVPQARSTLVEILMKQRNYEKIRSIFSKGDYFESSVRMLDRLALMGGRAAAMNNIMSWKKESRSDRDRIGDNEERLFEAFTAIGQLAIDELPKLKSDLEKQNGNLILVLTLEEANELNQETVKKYLVDNKDIVGRVLAPYMQNISDSLRDLKKDGVPIGDFKLGLQYILDGAMKGIMKAETEWDVAFDDEWSMGYSTALIFR